MKKICAILQPHYLPWIGYFEMISRVEKFIFLDDVKYIKREWKNRNKIRKDKFSKEFKWLSVPVTKDTKESLIKNVKISYDFDWVKNHLNSLKETYHKTKYFDEIYYLIEKNLMTKNNFLCKLNLNLIKSICGYLNINTKFLLSSELNTFGKKSDKLLNICKKSKSNYFLANDATLKYLNKKIFIDNNIKIEMQNYIHPKYSQFFGQKKLYWITNLSIVDLLFNHGEESKKIILNKI